MNCRRTRSFVLGLLLVSVLPTIGAEVRWMDRVGDWSTDAAADAGTRLVLGGASQLRLTQGRIAVGELHLGLTAKDRCQLTIDGGELVVRRGLMQIGDAGDSQCRLELRAGALHSVSNLYVGGANARSGPCTATLRIVGGSMLCRGIYLGWHLGADARMEIDGSRSTAIEVKDGLMLGDAAAPEPSTCTLAFRLDERGVTPIVLRSRAYGMSLENAKRQNRCRLSIELSAIPPRDDVTLIAMNRPTRGVFDDLPEGTEVTARFGEREFRWTLTYKGGPTGTNLVLTNCQGHRPTDPTTACRVLPKLVKPLWQEMPLHPPTDLSAPAPDHGFVIEGFGRTSQGGLGGKIIDVENLNDAGPGSLRAALAVAEPRQIRFKVAGEIKLNQALLITAGRVTVDGSTAPGGGVTLTGRGMVVKTDDVILRHFRIRPGDDDDDDALWFYDARRCVADHLSLCWANDETLSVTGLSDQITVQWCLIAESLNRKQHGYGSIAGGERVSWHHNLYAHHLSRVPRFAGVAQADFRQNLLYDWGHTAGYGEFERLNYVNNWLRPGPSTKPNALLFHQGEAVVDPGSVYATGNVMDGQAAITNDNRQGFGFGAEAWSAAPFPAPTITEESAERAQQRILDAVGANLPRRDAVDARIIRQTQDRTGRIINSTQDLPPQ